MNKFSMEIILMICGTLWIILGLVLKTENFLSSLVFKVIPFITGAVTCLCAMDMLGWVTIF